VMQWNVDKLKESTNQSNLFTTALAAARRIRHQSKSVLCAWPVLPSQASM
jgi:hypothetical protein